VPVLRDGRLAPDVQQALQDAAEALRAERGRRGALQGQQPSAAGPSDEACAAAGQPGAAQARQHFAAASPDV